MILGDRMKQYEGIYNNYLLPNLPVIVRIDGRAFHTWTRGAKRPYDSAIQQLFDETTKFLIEETGAIIAYTQSDEISLILYNFNKPDSQLFFNGNIAKLNSVIASLATVKFNSMVKKLATFDCRVFNVPNLDETVNYLIWREQDAVRNSISMAAQSLYPHKMLEGVKSPQLQDMLIEKGVNWNNYPDRFKRGGYFRRRLIERELTEQELKNIPYVPSSIKVTRSSIEPVNLPILTKIENRVDVIFYDKEPILGVK